MKSKQFILIISTLLATLIVKAQEPLTTKTASVQASANIKSEQRDQSNGELQYWQLNKKSSIKIKGVDLGEKDCTQFKIHFSEKLSFKIECGDFLVQSEMALTNTAAHTVSRKKGYTTITEYGYLIKKPQISQLDQSTLKVPYVSQIIHINQNEKNEISFYLESFKVDEFGRIVQDRFIQAYNLSNGDRKVSAHKQKAHRIH